MAVVHMQNPSTVTLVGQAGIHPDTGKPILKSKTFNNLDAAASHGDVYEVADALSELFSYPIVKIIRKDSSVLTEE